MPVSATGTLPALRDPVFIADLHLAPARPDATDAFLRFLAGPARRHAELVILGDLFNVWVGDDTGLPQLPEVIRALKDLTDSGVRLFVAHGNRDPLLGTDFMRATGAVTVTEPAATTACGVPILVAHGDAWCTRDLPLVRFRRNNHNPLVQRLFFFIPKGIRMRWARSARAKSEAGKRARAQRDAAVMDVVEETVARAVRAAGAAHAIHGHTHRCGHAALPGGAERWTLPDWAPDPPRPEGLGGWIEFSDGTPVLRWWN